MFSERHCVGFAPIIHRSKCQSTALGKHCADYSNHHFKTAPHAQKTHLESVFNTLLGKMYLIMCSHSPFIWRRSLLGCQLLIKQCVRGLCVLCIRCRDTCVCELAFKAAAINTIGAEKHILSFNSSSPQSSLHLVASFFAFLPRLYFHLMAIVSMPTLNQISLYHGCIRPV